jgi:hypothetical protein
MAKHRSPTGDQPPTGEEVVDSPGTAYWSVDDGRWPAPGLPAHLVDLLAPPIVVGVARVAPTSRLTPPRVVPAPPSAGPRTPGLRWPTPGPGGSGTGPARRPVPAGGPTGRHRLPKGPAERA